MLDQYLSMDCDLSKVVVHVVPQFLHTHVIAALCTGVYMWHFALFYLVYNGKKKNMVNMWSQMHMY